MLVESQWKLSPAYDLVYSYKPGSKWVDSHWMSLNGKRDEFTREDIYSLEKLALRFSRKYIDQIIDKTVEHVSRWPALAKDNDVPEFLRREIESNLRLKL